MEKILICVNSYDGYISLLNTVWNSVLSLTIPSGYKADYIFITEDTESKCIQYAKVNHITYYTTHTDFTNIEGFKTNINYVYPNYNKSIRTVWRIITMRNLSLIKAIEGDYDWLLNIDGDILPSIDGLEKLLSTNAKCIGARLESKTLPHQFYVTPENLNNTSEPFRCIIIGNCFTLFHKDTFNIPYSLRDEDLIGDPIVRCEELRKLGIRLWCHPGIVCEHLDV